MILFLIVSHSVQPELVFINFQQLLSFIAGCKAWTFMCLPGTKGTFVLSVFEEVSDGEALLEQR